MFDCGNADTAFIKGDYELAAKLYKEGARDGDARAAFNYGYCLLKGIGTEYNPSEAKSFFSFARDLEGGEAPYNIAMLYLRGEGVRQDYQKALDYMKLSAEKGCIEAQLYLGMAYTLGSMFEPDIVLISLIPFHKAEYRDLNTYFLPGADFEALERDEDLRCSVIKADQREAFEYFKQAAWHKPTYVEELVAKGQFLYAKCYVDGLGTDFNRDKGLRLMLAAGKSGSSEAVAYLQENGVTPEMLLSAAKKK